jgi:hypothetical protein
VNLSRRARLTLGYGLLAALAYIPPLLTAPGKVAADTKQYLYLNPGRLMSRAVSMWDPHVAMGTVTHQTIGYLFPMGPYYWIFDKLGVPDWIAQRLWLGSLLFFAALGMLYLLRTFGLTGAGVVVAALAYMCTPYVLDYAARISVLLMPWAALPWMIGLIRKALRDGGWRYPAIFALVVQVVGGVNATALIFAGVGPVLWILYSWLIARDVKFWRALQVTLRTGLLTLLTSLWWIAGLRTQGAYGLDVLKYSETVDTVAKTSTPNEVLRGLGYWFFYGQDRLGSWIEAARDYTQHSVVILAGYGLVVLALLAAAFLRWRHRAFFIVLLVVGVVIAVGAHPYDSPTPLGALFKAFATGSTAGLALRSTGRAVPLVALALAVFLGLGVNGVSDRLRRRGRTAIAIAVPVLVVILVFVNFPALVDGTFYGKNLQRPETIPSYWTKAIAALSAGGAGRDQTRILEEPGADFASYTWGNTVDPITPGLTDRPYVARELIPFGTPGTADLLNAIDRRLQEGVADPNGLVTLWRRMAIGDLVARNDIQYQRYDLVHPTELARVLAQAPGLGAPASYGPPSLFPSPGYDDEITLAAPPDQAPISPVVVYPIDDPVPIVRGESTQHAVMLSGDGEGMVDAADVGLLDNAGIVLYSASETSPSAVRAATTPGAVLVVTDENRLRARKWTSVLDNVGFTEQQGAADAPLTTDLGDARLDVFPGEQAGALTTTDDIGVQSVRATSYGNTITYTPEDRPAMAFDGDPTTAWRAAAFGNAIGQRIVVTLDAPITTDHVNLLQPTNRGRQRYITQIAMTFDGTHRVNASLGPASRALSGPGQTVTFPKRTFRTFAITVTSVNDKRPNLFGQENAIGFAEIGLRDENATHDVRVHEVEDMPTDLVDALGVDAAGHPLVYVMRRDMVRPVPPRDQPELAIDRGFTVPDARTFSLTGNATVSTQAPVAQIDAALGLRGVQIDASGFMAGCLQCAPSSAIDGRPDTAWQTPFDTVVGQWVSYTVPKPISFDHLDLQVIADGRHSLPTKLALDVDGVTRELTVPTIAGTELPNATRTVRISFPRVTGRQIKITIDAVHETRMRRYATAATVVAPVGIAELGIPGLHLTAAPARVDSGCRDDLVAIDSEPVSVRVTGAATRAGTLLGLNVAPCGASTRLALAAGSHTLTTARGKDVGFSIDRLVLASAAVGIGATPVALADGRVVSLGAAAPAAPQVQVLHNGATDMRVRVTGANGPFWLVLGESQSKGWQAHVVHGKNLGGSQLVDGYANGWLVTPKGSTFDVSFVWTPQKQVDIALWVSLLVALLCLGIAIFTWRRRRVAVVAEGDAQTDVDWQTGRRLTGRARWIAVAISGLLAAIIVTPWVGVLVAVLTVALTARARLRTFILLIPAALLALGALYIVVQQHRYHYPSVFEWPTLFPRARTPAWIAVVLLTADGVIEIVQRRLPVRTAENAPEPEPEYANMEHAPSP